ncbi:MAG: carbon-nitrogen hydrolase family protein [Patescibacteria group bacterium]
MERIKVAAVQSGVDPRWSPDEWVNHLRWQLAACREAGVQLAVFPAWSGAYQESYPRGFPEEALSTLAQLLGGLAREAGLCLVPGTIPVRCGDAIKIRGLVLSPSGDLLGAQDQLQPPPGFTPGGELAAIPSPVGRLGLIIGDDVQIPEIGRILALQGADLLCVPQALPAPHHPARQQAGLWQVVQANQVPGIEACLVGEWCGARHEGRSRIIGTVEMTVGGTGILAEATSLDRTEIVAGEIDYDGLLRARESFPIFSAFNLGLYRSRLPEAYRRLASAAAGCDGGNGGEGA